jgi:glyoxylase-like metal-dependent hydrolase (beta-lactamase superfamily II)
MADFLWEQRPDNVTIGRKVPSDAAGGAGSMAEGLTFDRDFTAPYGVAVALSARVTRVLAPNPGPFTFRGTGVYLVGAGDSVVVIDPGPDLAGHVAALRHAIGGRRLSHILITHTHRDHSPAAAALKAWSGARTFAMAAAPQPPDTGVPHGDAAMDEAHDRDFVPDETVRDGQVIAADGFTLTCVATPGHTAGHMAYALEEEGALFCGDHVMGWSTSVIAPPDGSMGAYMESLERLIARRDAILYPTHGAPVTRPQDYLRALLAHRREREAQVLAAWRDGHQDAASIAARLYPDIAPQLRAAAAVQVRAHLAWLAEQGRA